MTHQVVAFVRPMQATRKQPAAALPSSPTGLERGYDQTPVALSVALRYLAVRRQLRRTRVVFPAGAND